MNDAPQTPEIYTVLFADDTCLSATLQTALHS
jgi:hypothetical protein